MGNTDVCTVERSLEWIVSVRMWVDVKEMPKHEASRASVATLSFWKIT